VARCASKAGADLLLVLNAGLFRNLGSGSLASFLSYGNANDQTEDLLLHHILPARGTLPLVAGVLASDPTRSLRDRLARLRQLGVAGVTNWPAVGFVDGSLRAAMEAEGVGVAGEIEMLREAGRQGFITFGFALDADAAGRFAAAGVDALILNLGLTLQIDDIHEHRDQLQHAIIRLRAMQAAAQANGKAPLMLAFGGTATTPSDLEHILRHTDVHGYAGGSVFERLPVEETVSATISHFKAATVQPEDAEKRGGLGDMIGTSPAMRQVFILIKRVGPRDVSVVIEGESGTGKELVATMLHRLSARSAHAFVTVNCGAITESLIESELFGHEKGAFTGAHRRRLGKFELAHRGTLFLDEVADLSPHAQVALLRALQQGEITRVGGESSIPVDVRIVAASHQDLAQRVAEGRFRADLYYRLNGLTLRVPPLRERIADIPLLAQAIAQWQCVQWNLPPRRLAARFLARLSRHPWHGNVRELQHVLGHTLLLEDDPVIEGHSFHPDLTGGNRVETNYGKANQSSRRERAEQAVLNAHGNKSTAAAALGVTRKTLYAWLEK